MIASSNDILKCITHHLIKLSYPLLSSAVLYDVVYDIQNLNMVVCFVILIVLGDLCLAKFLFLL